MKSIKEKAKEAERNMLPLFESIRESDEKPVSVYDQDDMISIFEAGANYVLEQIEKLVKFNRWAAQDLYELIEQLKK